VKTVKGFSLIEVLVVISIALILAGLIFPVFASAKERANVVVCSAQLHQLQVATLLYRSSNEGDGLYGRSTAMGLPPPSARLHEALSIDLSLLRCSAPPNVSSPKQAVYMVLFSDDAPHTEGMTWGDYAQRNLDQSVIFGDVNHGDRSVPLKSPFFAHRGIGVRLSGEIFSVSKRGTWGDLSWWQ
jgi:prepilin-type N-terminal cleavage/methylation domain-containing protein